MKLYEKFEKEDTGIPSMSFILVACDDDCDELIFDLDFRSGSKICISSDFFDHKQEICFNSFQGLKIFSEELVKAVKFMDSTITPPKK